MNSMAQAKEIPLHDIKGLVEIQEYSLYYLSALVLVGLIVLLGLLYLLYKFLQNRKKFNLRKEHAKLLHKIDFSDAKKAAYEITYLGTIFKDDTPRHERAFALLVENLESYKYKKDVSSFSGESKHLFENYLGLIDV